MKNQLILMPSKKMDGNQKKGRCEDKLIRIGAKAREQMGLVDDKSVELWPTNTVDDRINRSKVFDIFKAFSSDLRAARDQGISEEEYLRVGFVTTRSFGYICGNGADNKKDVWIAQSIEDTVIGGDPEFILIDKNGLVQYAGYVDNFGSSGELANDGPLAEIRPKPAVEVEDFVKSIHDILSNHPNTMFISPYSWMAACCFVGSADDDARHRDRWPVGGHIHIGTPVQIAQKFEDLRFKKFYYVSLTRILDELLGVPLMKLDGKEASVNRRNSYGSYGGYRTDHGRLEFRSLSGMWMAHPKLATITLGVAKAITDSYFYMLESKNFDTKYISGTIDSNTNCFAHNFSSWDDIEVMKDFDTVVSSGRMYDILHKHAISYNKNYVDKLAIKLRKLVTYDKYANHIEGLIELVSLPWDELKKINCNLKETWINGEEFII